MPTVEDARLVELRRLFPITGRYLYLSHAGSGPLPAPTVKSLAETAEEKSLEGDLNYQKAEAVTEETRAMAARLMKVDPTGVAFIKNTSAGAIIAIGSIDWQPGDNVILMKDAFPTHSYAFNLLLPGIEKRYVTSTDLAEGPDCVFRLCDKHTRAVALDWVHFLSGIRADIDAIGKFCREFGIWFLVDAIQGLGPVNFDFGALDADFVYAGCNKWLLSPHGIGLLYVSPKKLDRLRPANLGWLSAQWTEFNDIYSEKPMKTGASRFEEGTKNYPAIYALRESLRIILDVGQENIDRHVRRLVDILRKGLLSAGFEIITPEEPARSAGIITCRKPGACNASIHAWLRTAGMICSLRQDMLRIAPYFYNTEDEVHRFVDRAADPAALVAPPSDCKT